MENLFYTNYGPDSLQELTEAELSRPDFKIVYTAIQTPWGSLWIGATDKGICHTAFYDSEEEELNDLNAAFPKAKIEKDEAGVILSEFIYGSKRCLHIKASKFQMKVLTELLKIPAGSTLTYGEVAAAIGAPKSVRAAATAVARNPVTLFIPCHRVVPASGGTGKYHWGSEIKASILNYEKETVEE